MIFKSVVLLLSCLALAKGFMQGAPVEACEKRVPRHDNTVPTHNRGEYSFTYSPLSGNKYEIVIDGNGKTFKGFMVQALNSRNKTVGSFQGDADNIQVIRECSAVTHYNAKPKNRVALVWSGPANDVHFWGTVVERYSKIYIDMLAHPAGNAHPAALAPKPAPGPAPLPHGQPNQGPVYQAPGNSYDYYDYYY